MSVYNVPHECRKNGARMWQPFTGSQSKTAFIQHVHILQLWYTVISKATWKSCRTTKFYTLINWVGGQCRNILPAAFSVLTDRMEVNAEKAKGNIFLHWPTNSVNKSFLALLTNPNNFIEKIDHTQQNSTAESSCELTSTLLVHGVKFYLSWVIKLKCSTEIDVYSSQTTVKKILNELFYPFQAQQN